MNKLFYLKEYRRKLGITQAEMGRKAGVARGTISRIERGAYTPSVTLAMRLADICQASVEEIFPRRE
ncbi:MAG: helix-turn-helix transcriptional regulator [Eubacteriales bacterium]|nr:helix-turn-helix transcriptional regulator [Eubacteriales bacterium]